MRAGQLSADEVVAAVATLYDDKLKPYADVLLQRLLARAAAGGGTPLPFIAPGRLRAICQECPRLAVRAEAAGDFSVLLADPGAQGRRLVDPADNVDPYSLELWDEMRTYFAKDGVGSSKSLPGNRYAAAVELGRLGLRRLRGLYLGEVAHVVSLATGIRRILGTRDGRIVPYWRSEAGAREGGPAGRTSSKGQQQRQPSSSSPDQLSDGSGGPASSPWPAASSSPGQMFALDGGPAATPRFLDPGAAHDSSPSSGGASAGDGADRGRRARTVRRRLLRWAANARRRARVAPEDEQQTRLGSPARGAAGAEATPFPGTGPAAGPPAAAYTAGEGRPIWQTATLPEELAFDVRLTFVHARGSSPAPVRRRLTRSLPPTCV
jgi:hypothetical protein